MPVIKKVARTECLDSMSSRSGVVRGSGPSSKVIATAFFPECPRLITGRKKREPGTREAAPQSRIKPARGITANSGRKNAAMIASLMEAIPAKWAADMGHIVSPFRFMA